MRAIFVKKYPYLATIIFALSDEQTATKSENKNLGNILLEVDLLHSDTLNIGCQETVLDYQNLSS